MHLPRLRAWLPDDRAAARLLESAIRHEQRVVPLVAPPRQPGPHVLEVPLSSGQMVCVVAEPMGLGRPDGVPLDLRPMDPVQMPDLFALVERLDNPSAARPPEPKPAPALVPPIAPIPVVAPAAQAAAQASAKWPAAKPEPPPPRSHSASWAAAKPSEPGPTMPVPPMPVSYTHSPAPAPAPVPVGRQDSAAAAAPRPAAGSPARPKPAPAPAPAARAAARNTAPSLPSPDLYELLDDAPEDLDVDFDIDIDQDLDMAAGVDPAYGGDDAPTLFQRPALRPRLGARDAVPPAPPPPPPATDEQLEATVARQSSLLGPDRTVLLPKSAQASGVMKAAPRAPATAPTAAKAAPVPAPPSPSATPSSAELIGRTIAGKYAIESSLGRGLSAEVYRAQHTSLNRAVAVKVLHQENQGNEQFVKRFKAEARTLSKLEHHNIARVIDFGEEPDGLLYLVMELLAGKSLEVLLRSGTKLTVRQVVDLGIQTCSGLAFAHDEGVIHRDVKPDNIVLVPHRDDDGKPCDVVKVCDFGLAKLRSTGTEPENRESDFTLAGALCGSPAYMSPEQLLGEPLDARTDIFALGVTLYEALSGKFPHEGAGLTELFVKKLTGEPTPLRTYVPNVDPALESAIMRAISRDKAARQSDARVFRQELRDVLARLK